MRSCRMVQVDPKPNDKCVCVFQYLFIWLCWVKACRTFDLYCGMRDFFFFFSCGVNIFSCSMWDLVLTRGQTQAPCIGSLESQPQDHQGSPDKCSYKRKAWGDLRQRTEDQVKLQVETGVMQPRVKERQELPQLDSLLEPLEAVWLCQHPDLGPVIPILDFWPPGL